MKCHPPNVPAATALVIVFVVKPVRIGTNASLAVSFPALTREATEIAVACVSANPARPAATVKPDVPNRRSQLLRGI